MPLFPQKQIELRFIHITVWSKTSFRFCNILRFSKCTPHSVYLPIVGTVYADSQAYWQRILEILKCYGSHWGFEYMLMMSAALDLVLGWPIDPLPKRPRRTVNPEPEAVHVSVMFPCMMQPASRSSEADIPCKQSKNGSESPDWALLYSWDARATWTSCSSETFGHVTKFPVRTALGNPWACSYPSNRTLGSPNHWPNLPSL